MGDIQSRIGEQIDLLQQELQAMQSRVRALKNIVRIYSLLSPRLDLDETLTAIEDFLAGAFQFDAFSILLKHGREPELRLQRYSGFSRPKKATYKLADSNSIYYYIASELKTLYLADLSHITSFKLDDSIGDPSGSLVSYPLINEDGRLFGILNLKRNEIGAFNDSEIEMLHDVSNQLASVIQKTMLHQTTKELAYTDSLTKVFNRRYFDQRIMREVLRAKRYGRVLSILMIDIDHFKIYNDTLGHLMGDSVLRKIASVFEENLRRADVVCRYGGEEFVVILPEIQRGQARLVAEKLRHAVLDAPFHGANKLPNGQLTVSIGVASFPKDGESFADLLKQADLALYQAKNTGRNQVVSA